MVEHIKSIFFFYKNHFVADFAARGGGTTCTPFPTHLTITLLLIIYSHRLCKRTVATSINESLLASPLKTSDPLQIFSLHTQASGHYWGSGP